MVAPQHSTAKHSPARDHIQHDNTLLVQNQGLQSEKPMLVGDTEKPVLPHMSCIDALRRPQNQGQSGTHTSKTCNQHIAIQAHLWVHAGHQLQAPQQQLCSLWLARQQPLTQPQQTQGASSNQRALNLHTTQETTATVF